MKSTSFLSISTMVFTLSSTALAAVAAEIHCPASVTETPTVSTEEKQWIVVAIPGERNLERVGIYLGNPSEYGAQVPDSTKTVKKKETVTWRLTRSETDTFWVGCSYVGTTAMLFQKVDAKATTCVASYDLLPSGRRQRLSAMVCQ